MIWEVIWLLIAIVLGVWGTIVLVVLIPALNSYAWAIAAIATFFTTFAIRAWRTL